MKEQLFYAVGTIRNEMEVESNLPFKIPLLKLQWCDKQIGALPVFATREDAEEFANGAPIIALRPTEEVVLDSEV